MLRGMLLRGLVVVSVLLLGLTACGGGDSGGGGGGGSTGKDADAVRRVMTDLLVAATRDDMDSVRDYLDPGQYLSAKGSADAFQLDKLTEEEQESALTGCFSQVKSVVEFTVINDRATAESTMSHAMIEVLKQTRRASVVISAKDAEGPANVSFTAKLSQSAGGTWRLITCELD